MSYALLSEEETKKHQPKVVFVDENNDIIKTTVYEKHGLLQNMNI